MIHTVRTSLLAGAAICSTLGLPGIAYANEYTVTAKEFKFIPDSINLTKGEDVTITLKNTGAISHNLTFSALGGLKTRTIQTGSTDTIHFTAQRTGAFSFYCAVPGHKEAGMRGHLTVK